MITRWDLITKKAELSPEEFKAYWNQQHAPVVLRSQALRRYTQNFVTDSQQRGVAFPRVSVTADAFAELWYDNLHDMNASQAAYGEDIAADYRNFASDVKSLVTVKSLVIPIEDKPLLKRVSFIKRKTGMTFEQFKHEWWYVHGDFVRQFKGVRGYCQSLILDRVVNGKSVSYEEVPFDGIVELYFDDLEGLSNDFASEVGQTAQAHARTFLENISTYIVEKTDCRG